VKKIVKAGIVKLIPIDFIKGSNQILKELEQIGKTN